MNRLIIWWCSVQPKAKWLIVWATVYFIVCMMLLLLEMFDDWNWLNQFVWIFISAISMWNRRLATWLQMRPKITDWFKLKLK